MVVPLLTGAAVVTFAPGASKFFGSFTEALFNGALTILAVFGIIDAGYRSCHQRHQRRALHGVDGQVRPSPRCGSLLGDDRRERAVPHDGYPRRSRSVGVSLADLTWGGASIARRDCLGQFRSRLSLVFR
jgi:2-keto-3-deoxygluconate permease